MATDLSAWLDREKALLGETAVARLQTAKVAVFGLGGVGSYAAEALARAGIGALVLCDGDTVDVTNLNRQLCATVSSLGKPKAEVVAARVADINPACQVTAAVTFYSATEGQGLIDGCDFVVDAIDDVKAKVALALECKEKHIPLVAAMGCGNKLNPMGFQVADLANTTVCPLCRVMRRELKAVGITHLPVVYSTEPPHRTPAADGERVPPASISFVPSAAGLLLAAYVVTELTKEDD